MAQQLPTVKHLRYLVALTEQLHFGRAAASCFVSQSAFSLAIRELEETLGVSLVDRTPRRVTVTPVGHAVAIHARRVLEELNALVDEARAGREPLAGALRIGVIPTIAPFLLPRVLPGLREHYPKLEPFLREEMTERLHEELLEGRVDLIVVAIPYDLREAEVMPLFDDPFLLAYHEGTERLDPQRIDPTTLPTDSVLLLEEGHCLRGHAIEACRLREAETVSRFAATSLFTLLQMVESDLGVTFLPQMAVGSSLLTGTHITTRPLHNHPHRTIALAWRRGSARAEAFRTLGETIQALQPTPSGQ